jgi:hypothetical protein
VVAEHREVTFTDELLSDGGVYRRFSDGVEEWRWRDPEGTVWWRDNRGRHGTDEPLNSGIIKRTYRDGHVLYGRDVGFGWTHWSDRSLTLNVTGLPRGTVTLLVRVGPRTLLGMLPAPPAFLDPTQEQELRRSSDPGVGGGAKDVDWTDLPRDEFVDDFG